MVVGGKRHVSAALPAGKRPGTHFTGAACTQDRSGRVRKIGPRQGLDRRTVQPVSRSLYRLSYRGPQVSLTVHLNNR